MNNTDKAAMRNARHVLYVITLVTLCFMGYNEYHTVRDSLLQSQLEAEYAYDYACSPSSQIIRKTEYGRNTYIVNTLWVNCGGLEWEVGNFVRPLHEEKKYAEPNGGLSVLLET